MDVDVWRRGDERNTRGSERERKSDESANQPQHARQQRQSRQGRKWGGERALRPIYFFYLVRTDDRGQKRESNPQPSRRLRVCVGAKETSRLHDRSIKKQQAMPDKSHYTQAQSLLFLFRAVLWDIEIASSLVCLASSLHESWFWQIPSAGSEGNM